MNDLGRCLDRAWRVLKSSSLNSTTLSIRRNEKFLSETSPNTRTKCDLPSDQRKPGHPLSLFAVVL